MNAAARVVFALLVAATFAAFFVAQRLKHTPTVLQQVRGPLLFSPNGDGRNDTLPITFQVKSTDVISADVIDRDDNSVASILEDRFLKAHTPITIRWNGRDDSGARVPDGIYRVRVTLRDEGRTVVIRHNYRLDTTPPVPMVKDVGPAPGAGPELLPNKVGGARIQTSAAGPDASVAIFRTSGQKPEEVARLGLKDQLAIWDGRIDGAPAEPGSYLAVAQWRDRAGNLGSSVPIDARTHLPELPYGAKLPGHGGITVRYLELQPPAEPVRGNAVVTIGVDARGKPYTWSLKEVGAKKPVKHGRATHSPFHLHAPAGRDGLYLFVARSGAHTATTPIVVSAVPTHKVLVVLPFMTWQGRNPVDDDGDGAPNVLDRGQDARLYRVFAGGRMSEGFREMEGPLLSYLDKEKREYDITTDVALAAGHGPQLAGHTGVILPGDVRWLPRETQLALRAFVRDGGALLLTGTDSLRREVQVSGGAVLTHPTPAADTTLFGTKLRPVVTKDTSVTNLEDKIQFFTGDVFGGTGVLAGFPGYEPTAALGANEDLKANAVTDDGTSVVVAAQYGKGLEIRTGLLDFATRLEADANAGQLVLRAWTLLST